MSNIDLFKKLEDELHKRYKPFPEEELFIDYEPDFFVVDCHKYMYDYVNKNYYRWVIPFIKKFLKNHGFEGHFYFIEYAVKV